MTKPTIILYGSYGYTGKLIARECRSRNLSVILSGRNKEALQKQGDDTGYAFEVVDMSDAAALNNLLQKGALLIHCAGPFQYTARQMVEACVATGTHYTDITGEYGVFETLAAYGEKGKDAGIMIMPGTGFDVVPTDCLALYLKNRLPAANHLLLAFAMSKGGLSRGTAKTSIEGLGRGSMIRKDGKLLPVPLGENVMEVDFGSFKTKALNIPWGDISTAWRSTGIPNIAVYMGASDKMIRSAKMITYFGWLVRLRWVKEYLKRRIDRRPPGPTAERRASGKSFLWGKVWDDDGNQCISTLETINGYSLTAKTSVLIAERILQGDFVPGYQTPAMVYGPDLILALDHTIRVDR
ncbi:MAG: saccharopine dehydrogenase NADP-binding domain-containing protein [Cyclobacteriaceae bacterium]|nr:saccharopine dehydrogenase NADP-binding domain-containing protein [Cyclobacteriaceae bacterium]MDH4295206.1 saccharopine dehydrogenase NADP-binding domain-containing protein [Cyclobacteriaceae bacterium]MDH5248904.1 saccharopine dehydrogenase NADP-binding domain-containing protein [Cyclobacteriaceae bacterium]